MFSLCARLVFCVLVALVAACSSQQGTSELVLGGEVDLKQMKNATKTFAEFREQDEATEVVLKGKIGKVCPAGCWFYLESDDDMTYVDVLGDFEVPQFSSGRTSWVRGRISGTGGARILQAMRVVVAPAK